MRTDPPLEENHHGWLKGSRRWLSQFVLLFACGEVTVNGHYQRARGGSSACQSVTCYDGGVLMMEDDDDEQRHRVGCSEASDRRRGRQVH